MALHWTWEDKCGEATFVQIRNGKEYEYKVNLYNGNACLIMLCEWKEGDEDMYSMWNFWADKKHMRNCLGLNKKGGYSRNLYNDDMCRFTKFRINKVKCRGFKDILTALAEADFDNLVIEIAKED